MSRAIARQMHPGRCGCFLAQRLREAASTDGPIAGAAAKIPAKLVVDLPRLFQIITVIPLEERHDETGRAIAALRALAFDHRALDRMQLAVTGGDTFHRHHFAPSQQRQRDEATVDGAVANLALRVAIPDGYRAGAAIAFGATFLGTGATCTAQIFEERGIGRAARTRTARPFNVNSRTPCISIRLSLAEKAFSATNSYPGVSESTTGRACSPRDSPA